jgi:hypothetical protein
MDVTPGKAKKRARPRTDRPFDEEARNRISEPNIVILSDGAIANPKIERFALFIADEVSVAVAWRLVGGREAGGSHQYRRRLEADPRFQKRLAELVAEKEKLMSGDDPFADAKWMVAQMWREARAKGDSTMMGKALDARLKILDKEDARRDAAEAPGRPGRPSLANPQATAEGSDIRARLLARGAPVPNGVQPAAIRQPSPDGYAEIRETPVAVLVEPEDFMARLDRAVPAPRQPA